MLDRYLTGELEERYGAVALEEGSTATIEAPHLGDGSWGLYDSPLPDAPVAQSVRTTETKCCGTDDHRCRTDEDDETAPAQPSRTKRLWPASV